jgi:hypothetical protein
MKQHISFWTIVSSLIFLVGVTGCSPTGWLTKELPDGSSFDKGDQVTVLTKNGSSTSGMFLGLESVSEQEYANQFFHSVPLNSQVPEIGEAIRISTSISPDKIWEGKFVGFDYKNLWVKFSENTNPQPIYITNVFGLADSRGHSMYRMNLRQMFVDGDLPLMTALTIKTTNGIVYVPINTVAEIQSNKSNESVVTLLSGNDFRSGLLR